MADNRVYLAPSLPWGWIDAPPSLNRLIGLRWRRPQTTENHQAKCTRPQGERMSVRSFSEEPGEIGLTSREKAGDGVDQDAKGRLAQLPTGLSQ